MSRLIDEYTRNKSPEDKKEVERRVREMAGTMSELSALMLVLEEMRQEGKAGGGRIGFNEGLGSFETNDPEEAAKEILKRNVDRYVNEKATAIIPLTENISLTLGPEVDKIKLGGILKILGGELNIASGMKGEDKGIGFSFSKKFAKGGRIGLAEGTKKFMFNDVLREPMSELERMSVGNPGTKEMYASEIREMLAQNRDEAKVKIPKKKKKQKPLKIDLEKIKKLIQKAKAREGAADGGIGYLLGE